MCVGPAERGRGVAADPETTLNAGIRDLDFLSNRELAGGDVKGRGLCKG